MQDVCVCACVLIVCNFNVDSVVNWMLETDMKSIIFDWHPKIWVKLGWKTAFTALRNIHHNRIDCVILTLAHR